MTPMRKGNKMLTTLQIIHNGKYSFKQIPSKQHFTKIVFFFNF